MTVAVNKVTFQVMSGNINNYPETSYVKYEGVFPECDSKYWKWNNDFKLILEMSETEKTVVDEFLLESAKVKKEDELDKAGDAYVKTAYNERSQRNAALDRYDSVKKKDITDRIDASMEEFYLKVGQVNDALTVEDVEAIRFSL